MAQTNHTNQANYARRLVETRKAMEEAGLDGLLIVSQYNRRYLTGFSPEDGDITETAGWALVTPQRLYLITGTFNLISLEHEIVPSGTQVLLTDTEPRHRVLASAMVEQGLRRLGFEQHWVSYGTWDRIQRNLPEGIKLVPCDDLLAQVRASKDEAEIAVIRRAAAISEEAFAQLLRELRPGMTERQVAFRLEELMRQRGAEGPSFPSIIACGPGGALPHYVPTDRELRAGEPLLMDFGCRVDGYCSDLTRTLCLGEPSPKLVEVYGIVRASQTAGEGALAQGVRRGRDADAASRKVMVEAGYGEAYLHSLGHGVGMAVHELPALPWPRSDDPDMLAEIARVEGVTEGAVVTIEPGIYLAGWGGVRLEDMVLITHDGIELLAARNPEQIVHLPV